MKIFRKVLFFKIICLTIGIYIFSNTAVYSIPVDTLRPKSMFDDVNSGQGEARSKDILIEKILGKMSELIPDLKKSWKRHYYDKEDKDGALSIAEGIVDSYFRGDKVGNSLNPIGVIFGNYYFYRTSYDSEFIFDEKHKNMIEQAIKDCEEVIKRLDNTQIEKLQDDLEINEYIEFLVNREFNLAPKVTKDDVKKLEELKPEEIRSIIALYINDLKPIVSSLRRSFNVLIKIYESPNDDIGIEEMKRILSSETTRESL